MIQRIQSLYLLISTILMVLTIFFPFVVLSTIQGTAQFSAFALQFAETASSEYSTSNILYSLGISIVLTAILSFVIIFLYKKRKVQIKLARYSFILKLAIIAVVAYDTYVIRGILFDMALTDVTIQPGISLLFVLIAMVFDWLAVKVIRKDEDLVRSIDRIR